MRPETKEGAKLYRILGLFSYKVHFPIVCLLACLLLTSVFPRITFTSKDVFWYSWNCLYPLMRYYRPSEGFWFYGKAVKVLSGIYIIMFVIFRKSCCLWFGEQIDGAKVSVGNLIMKLMQWSRQELVVTWAGIVAVDMSCEIDLSSKIYRIG